MSAPESLAPPADVELAAWRERWIRDNAPEMLTELLGLTPRYQQTYLEVLAKFLKGQKGPVGRKPIYASAESVRQRVEAFRAEEQKFHEVFPAAPLPASVLFKVWQVVEGGAAIEDVMISAGEPISAKAAGLKRERRAFENKLSQGRSRPKKPSRPITK